MTRRPVTWSLAVRLYGKPYPKTRQSIGWSRRGQGSPGSVGETVALVTYRLNMRNINGVGQDTPSARYSINSMILLLFVFQILSARNLLYNARYRHHWAGRFRASGRIYFCRRLAVTGQEAPAGLTHIRPRVRLQS
jgi:hypothetical protein